MNISFLLVPLFYACTNTQSQNMTEQSNIPVAQEIQTSSENLNPEPMTTFPIHSETVVEESIVKVEAQKSVSAQENTVQKSIDNLPTIPAEPVQAQRTDSVPQKKAASQKKETIEKSNVVTNHTPKKEEQKVLVVETVEPPMQEPSVQTELERHISEIEKHFAQMTSLDMDFEQTIENEAFDGVLTQSGTIHLMEPHYFLWDIKFPLEQSYYFTGSQLQVWNPTTNQLIVSAYHGEQGNVASILQNLSSLSSEYNVQILTQSSSRITLELAPQKDLGCSKMHLSFHAKTYDIVGLHSVCRDTGKADIVFSNPRKNKRSNPSLFVWNPPADAEIIIAQELLHP